MFDTFISHYHPADFKSLHKKLNIIMEQNERIDAALARLTASNEKVAASVTEVATSQTNIAGDIRRIKDGLLNGDDYNRVAAKLEEQATKAEANAETLATAAASLTALDKENEPEVENPPVDNPPVDNPPAEGGENVNTGNVDNF